jgi:RNA polymerase sigma-70 factor (ECF subfamily)
MAHRLDPERLGDHVDRLYRAALALTGVPADAEDLVQDTYVRILARPRFMRSADDLGYLLRVLRNTFLTRRRDAGRRPREVVLAEEPSELRTAGRPDAALEAREVLAAIAALPDDFRDVVVHVDVAGLSYAEAAELLGIPQGTVMSRLYRGRQRLADQVG